MESFIGCLWLYGLEVSIFGLMEYGFIARDSDN